MNREQFVKITESMRRVAARCPGGVRFFDVPTYLCAGVYIGCAGMLLCARDGRLWRFLAVPAATFLLSTLIRRVINRARPYDRLRFEPVGKAVRGKGRSMPSRHAASAMAIALAVSCAYPLPWVIALMGTLGVSIAALRVLRGMHYPSDVLMAAALAALCALAGAAFI